MKNWEKRSGPESTRIAIKQLSNPAEIKISEVWNASKDLLVAVNSEWTVTMGLSVSLCAAGSRGIKIWHSEEWYVSVSDNAGVAKAEAILQN